MNWRIGIYFSGYNNQTYIQIYDNNQRCIYNFGAEPPYSKQVTLDRTLIEKALQVMYDEGYKCGLENAKEPKK